MKVKSGKGGVMELIDMIKAAEGMLSATVDKGAVDKAAGAALLREMRKAIRKDNASAEPDLLAASKQALAWIRAGEEGIPKKETWEYQFPEVPQAIARAEKKIKKRDAGCGRVMSDALEALELALSEITLAPAHGTVDPLPKIRAAIAKAKKVLKR